MTLTQEQAKQIKQQILKQIESWPDEQRIPAKQQIEAMNPKQLEEFLVKNKLLTPQSQPGKQGEQATKKQECIFCNILQDKVPCYKIDENKSNLAILEINPLSKGHSLVISKEHKKLSSSAFTLANKIAKKLKTKLKPEQVKIESSNIQGHQLINIIPIYKDGKLEQTSAPQKDLILLQEKLAKKKEPKPKEIKELDKIKKIQLPIRIP